MSDWSPTQYERFRDERSQPFHDLASLLEKTAAPPTVLDLGCGTGELTRSLHVQLGARETLGIDSSPAMLARSTTFVGEGLNFAQGDIGELEIAGPYDIVFTNAALHWLPHHEELFARLTALVAPDGGQLAVQMPANFDHPSHVVANEVAAEEPFVTALAGWRRESPVLAPEAYAQLLHRLGYRRQHVRLVVYPHLLAERGEVVEWVRGTLLTDFERRLGGGGDLYARFLERYRAVLLPRLEDTRPYFYPFKRLLLWARR